MLYKGLKGAASIPTNDFVLHIKVWLPVLVCAVKTVEGDFRFFLDDLSKCRTNSQRKSQLSLDFLYDIYME